MRDPRIGRRCQLHAATSAWMQGDRYGEVVGIGRARPYVHTTGNGSHVTTIERPLRVKLDKSGRVLRFHPENVFLLSEGE